MSETVTQLLVDWQKGSDDALEQLLPLVYDELRRIADRRMRGERGDHTLQATALVNEAFMRLVGMEVSWSDRAHFMAVASNVMRRLLIDHARGRRRLKRGGGVRITLDDGHAVERRRDVELLALDDALRRLAEIDERKSRILELFYFGGLTGEGDRRCRRCLAGDGGTRSALRACLVAARAGGKLGRVDVRRASMPRSPRC